MLSTELRKELSDLRMILFCSSFRLRCFSLVLLISASCHAMLCKHGLCRHAVSVRLTVCLSVMFVNSVKNLME